MVTTPSLAHPHASIPAGDTSEAVPILPPPEKYEGERAMTKDNHDLGKPDLNYGGAGEQVEQVLRDQAAKKKPLLEDQAVHIETLIELGADDDATAAMFPVTKNTHYLGKLDRNPWLKSHSPPGSRLVIPEGDPADALAGLQKQMAQPKAKATIPAGNTSKVVPTKLDEGERAMTRHIHDLGSFDPISGGAGG